MFTYNLIEVYMDNEEITGKIIGAGYEVMRTLGCGFLEKVYDLSLCFELSSKGYTVKSQVQFPVYFKSNLVGHYIPDILVNDVVIVEIKAVKEITEIHKAQLINYLKICKLNTGLILNFGNPKLEIKRIINVPRTTR